MPTQLAAPTDKPATRRRTGCGFLVASCIVSCVFLFLNVAIVTTIYPVLANSGPPLLQNDRVAQALLYAAPVLLVFVEWWLFDLIVDRLPHRLRQRAKPPR